MKLIYSTFVLIVLFPVLGMGGIAVRLKNISNNELKVKAEHAAQKLLSNLNIKTGSVNNPDPLSISDNAWQCALKIGKLKGFHLAQMEIERSVLFLPDSFFEARDIYVDFIDSKNEKIKRPILISFNQHGIITQLGFALDSIQVNVIINCNDSSVCIHRSSILRFLDTYYNSFFINDFELVQKVFNNELALIWEENNEKKVSGDKEKFLKVNNEEFISKLKNAFTSGEPIISDIKEIFIENHPKFNNVYGVSFREKLANSVYNNSGWIFIKINFTSKNEPTIKVVTWLPSIVNGKEIKHDEVFSLGDFPTTE